MRGTLSLVGRVLVALLVASTLAPRHSDAQSGPSLTIEGIFGHSALIADGPTTVLVTADNPTASAFQGSVVVQVSSWQGALASTEVRLDLPARSARQARVLVPLVSEASGLAASYVVSGRSIAQATTSPSYAPSGVRALVFLDDPPRLRAALVGLQPATAGSGGGEIPLAAASVDARSGDLLLPESPLGYGGVGAVVTTVQGLARAGSVELAALEGWVHQGGAVVLIPQTPSDLDHPFVRRTLGTLQRSSEPAANDSLLALLGLHEAPLDCGHHTRESFGCGAHVGFGRVWILDADVSQPSLANQPPVAALFQSLARASIESDYRLHPLFHGPPPVDPVAIRQALDPNEGNRPALAFVALVLFAYVIAVGPVNFTIVERRKQPTLALVSTPLLALLALAATFAVGYVGKGVTMRYRRMTLVEAVDGSSHGRSNSFTSLYFTRPTTAELSVARDATVESVGHPVATRVDNDHLAVGPLSAGLWETVLLRITSSVDLRGGIRVERDGTRLARIRNDSDLTLRSVAITDPTGALYAVGEVAPGATVEIPTTPTSQLTANPIWAEADPNLDALLGTLGYRTDARGAVFGLFTTAGEGPNGGVMPTLYARIDPDAPPATSPSFDADQDFRILRLALDVPPGPTFVPRAPTAPLPPEPADYAEFGPPDPVPQDAALPDAPSDAGVRP